MLILQELYRKGECERDLRRFRDLDPDLDLDRCFLDLELGNKMVSMTSSE